MQLSNSFTIARPVQEVYDALLDIDRIATCMPGSTLLGQSGADTYDGEVKVKVGPLSAVYAGQFTILDRDPANHRLTMRAKGREKRGAGNADAYIVATLADSAGGTVVQIDTELDIRGKVAQFGRGVIADVSDSIMQNFAGNVEQMLLSGGQPTSASTASAAPEASVPASAVGKKDVDGPAPTAAPAVSAEGLDAWNLIVKPLLQRYAGSVVTIALAGLAAYVGARHGARVGHRPVPARRRPSHY